MARGELWAIDFEPQTHREEPGKPGRPALVMQSDALNSVGHGTTIVVPGTSRLAPGDGGDLFPLRVRLGAGSRTGLRVDTDLLIDQVRAVSNQRLLKRLGVVSNDEIERAQAALGLLMSR